MKKPTVAVEKFNFHGDDLDVVRDGGEAYAVLARLCAPLGVSPSEQAKKLRKLAWAQTVKITVWENGLKREVVCLSIRSVAGWLFTINAGKIAPHLREKLALYQRECADVLADHFLGRRAVAHVSVGLAEIREAFKAELAQTEQTIATLNTRLAALESSTALVANSVGPVIGEQTAELRIKSALREAARIESRAVHNEGAFKRLRNNLDNDLRRALNFHRSGGMSWAMLPTTKLGKATDEVAVMMSSARSLAGASMKKPTQLVLVANGNGKKTAV